MRHWIFAIFASVLIAFSANATVNDGHVTTTVGYVTHELDTRQDEFPAQSGTKAMTFGDDAGEIGAREVKSDLGSSTSDDSLPTVSAVNDGLDDKQDVVPANNTNTVLTYTGTAGNVGAKGIYQNSGTYANQMDNLVTAGTFNTALRNGLESEFVCAETDPSNGQCWAWSINNNGGPWNYFYMDDIPEGTDNYGATIVRNSDGSLTITLGRNGYTYAPKLGVLAPGLEIGKRYKLSITTTGKKLIYLSSAGGWDNNQIKTITANMLNSTVFLYATTNSAGSTATISEIKITAVESGTPVGASGTILPAGYTPLEYIQSRGAQYIDTGVTQSTRAVLDMQAPAVSSDRVYFMYAKLDSSDYTDGFGVYRQYVTGSNTLDVATRRVYDITYNADSMTITADGATIQTPIYHIPNNAQIALFGTNAGNRKIEGKLYSVQIYNGNTIVRNFVPARRNSDSALGMYDLIGGAFYENLGTGSFTAGPDANNNLYLPQNQ